MSRKTPPELRDRVVELKCRGASTSVIIDATGVGERTIYRILRDAGMGKDPNYMSQDEVDRAREMLEDGASYMEVARTLGRSHSTIKRNLPGYTWSPEQAGEFAWSIRILKRKLPKGF